MVRSLLSKARHFGHAIYLIVENTTQATLRLCTHQELTHLFMFCRNWDICLLLLEALELTITYDENVPIRDTFCL